jgi:hypothetical protein
VSQVVAGKLDNKPVFLDLVQVITVETERRERGVGLQNMKYPPGFDAWCHELLCICPEAYRSFRMHLAGHTERSFLFKCSISPGFFQGISHQALERAHKYLMDYRYPINAPLSLSVDNTKLLPSLRPYFDGINKKWFLVGTTGEPLEISDLNLLEEQIESARSQLATKLRLWVLQIPLPHIPCLILAIMPLLSSTDTATLAQMEQHLLYTMLASDKPLCIVSLGSDGSILERDARRALVRNGFAEMIHHIIPNPSSALAEPIMIPVLRIYGHHLAVIQDPKHGRKTGRNNLFSGARLLVLGNHMVCYKQIRKMAKLDDTPLYWRDVDRLDRQDDRAAARLFSAAFLEFCASRHGENPGLPVYLFILGELIDAYENRHIPHLERIKMVLRMWFFKSIWKSFLHRAGYSQNQYFISSAADDIIDILVDGLLALIYIHRDHLDRKFPLLPWMHGSEANEHVFGLLRKLIADFTLLDVLRLIPKLNVRLMAACNAKNTQVDFKSRAAGYSHTYFDGDGVPLGTLSNFPSDDEISQAASIAFDEANALWDLLGYDNTSSDPGISVGGVPLVPPEHEVDDDFGDSEDAACDSSDRCSLQEALDLSTELSGLGKPMQSRLDEYSYAAACIGITEQEKM